MFGAYGHIGFEIFGINPKSIKESFGRRKIKHNVINKYPIIEDTGELTRNIEITINIAKPFSDNPEDDFKELIDLMNQTKAQTLIIGQEILGKFTIENIDKEAEYKQNGEVIKITANIKLIEVKNVD